VLSATGTLVLANGGDEGYLLLVPVMCVHAKSISWFDKRVSQVPRPDTDLL
jgi:hypothetical protein